MNVKTTIATISILSALSFGVFAADSINDNQAANLKPMGTITVSGINGAPSDIRLCLIKPMLWVQKRIKLSKHAQIITGTPPPRFTSKSFARHH